MNSALTALYDLQLVDSALARIEKQYRSLDSGAVENANLEMAQAEFTAAEKSHHASSAEMQDADLELKSVGSKIKEFETKLYDGKTTNFKELQAFGLEVEALKRQSSKLETRILELGESLKATETAKSSANDELTSNKASFATKSEAHSAGEKKFTGQIRTLMGERQKRAAKVPAALLKRYENLRKAKQGVGVARLVDSRCETCHTNLPSNLVTLVTETDAIETCENCGRLLVVTA